MAEIDETLRTKGDLPVKGKPAEPKTPEEPTESPDVSTEPSAEKPEESGKESEKGKFINALGKKNKTIDTLSKENINLRKKVRAAEEADLSDSEKMKHQLEEVTKENFKLKMKIFVNGLLKENGLENNPIAEICRNSPWAVPAVQQALSDRPTWDETEDAVRAYLPGYLEQIAKTQDASKPAKVPAIEDPEVTPETPATPEADPQRTAEPNLKKKVWTRREIAKLSPAEYREVKSEILKATAEGRIVD